MDGLLLVDKPAGWTSHDVVAKLRHIIGIRRIGHAGTLDPFATGLLLLGIGKGTKALHELSSKNKAYRAHLTLGVTSSTFDPEGVLTITDPPPHPCTREDIEQALETFRGGYEQRAPLFSAKKRDGMPLYRLARQGAAEETMRPVKRVLIAELTIERYTWPHLELFIRCGTGTYIRSFGDDLGHNLGVGAYVSALQRTEIDSFSLKEALSWEPIPTKENVQQALLPLPTDPR